MNETRDNKTDGMRVQDEADKPTDKLPEKPPGNPAEKPGEKQSDTKVINIKIPLAEENLREELNFYRELRTFFKEYDKPVEDVDFVITNIEADLEKFNESKGIELDEEAIIAQLEKHPYFKNPGDYPIRLLSLLKYLKEKGFNMHYTDIDLYIDRVVQKLDGVKKVGKNLYQKTKNN